MNRYFIPMHMKSDSRLYDLDDGYYFLSRYPHYYQYGSQRIIKKSGEIVSELWGYASASAFFRNNKEAYGPVIDMDNYYNAGSYIRYRAIEIQNPCLFDLDGIKYLVGMPGTGSLTHIMKIVISNNGLPPKVTYNCRGNFVKVPIIMYEDRLANNISQISHEVTCRRCKSAVKKWK